MQQIAIRKPWFIVCAATGAVLVATGIAQGVLVDPSVVSNIKALRVLLPPEMPPGVETNDHQLGGMDGDGNVFAAINSIRGHPGCHCEDPLIWRRDENYVGRRTFGQFPWFAFASDVFSLDFAAAADLDSEVISQDVRNIFAANGVPLSGTAVVLVNQDKETGKRASWTINDFDPQNYLPDVPIQEFDILPAKGNLSVSDVSSRKPQGVHAGENRESGAVGFRHTVNVSEGGHVGGSMNAKNWDAFHYSFETDRFTIFQGGFLKDADGNQLLDDKGNPRTFEGGQGVTANNNGIVLSTYSGYSERPLPFIASPDHPDGVIQFIGGAGMNVWDINDAGVIVGDKDTNPFRLMPRAATAGENGGFPSYDPLGDDDFMDELGPVFVDSRAHALSNNASPIIVGTSRTFAGDNGAVWDIDGNILQDLGLGRFPFGITDDGTLAYGSIKILFPQSEEAAFWISHDGWESFTEVSVEQLLQDMRDADVEGAELAEKFFGRPGQAGCCWVGGANSSGQLAVQGFMTQPGISGGKPSSGTNIFIVDTQDLDVGVIKGDANNDGIVDFLDITPFIHAQSAEGDEGAFLELTVNGCFLCGDINMDGVVDFLDITPFVNLLDQLGAASAVPEPATMLLLAGGALLLARRDRGGRGGAKARKRVRVE